MTRGWSVVLLVAGCGRVGFDARGFGDAGDTIDAAAGPARSTLTLAAPATQLADFPLLVVLDDTRAARNRIGDGADLRFFDANGQVLAHELEQLGVPGGPPLIAWVHVPLIDAATTLTVAYGGETGPRSTAATWPSPYAAVWHLAVDGVAHDSAGSHEAMPTGTHAVAGQIGAGRAFVAASHEFLTVANTTDITPAAFTVSAWFDGAAIPTNYTAIISRQVASTSDNDIYLGFDLSQAVATCEIASGEIDALGGGFAGGVWHHYASVADATIERLFIDGVEVGSAPTGSPLTPQPNRPIFLGGDRSDGSGSIDVASADFLDGVVDEVRVETVARPAAWIAYDALAGADHAITYGPVSP